MDGKETLTKPSYTPEVQVIITDADSARNQYNAANTEFTSTTNELKFVFVSRPLSLTIVSDLRKDHAVDLGDNMEYATLQGECFELLDREFGAMR